MSDFQPVSCFASKRGIDEKRLLEAPGLKQPFLLRFFWIFDRNRPSLLFLPRLFSLVRFGPACTVVAPALDVVFGGHRGNHDVSAFAELLGVAQGDPRTSVVVLNRALDFNLPPFELANVTHFSEVVRQHDHREGTRVGVFAEVEEREAVAAIVHVEYGSADALGCAHMPARFSEGDAVMLGSVACKANAVHGKNGSKNGSGPESQNSETHGD